MDVVAVIAQKGGAGKTTLSVSLAVEAQRAGRETAIIDLDPQTSAANWGDRRSEDTPAVAAAPSGRLKHVLSACRDEGAEFVVIDTPRAEEAALAAAKVADLAIIPCAPSILDLETVPTTLDLVRIGGSKPAIAVLNEVPPRGAEREEAIAILKGMGLAVCPTVFGQRKAFKKSITDGVVPQEFEPRGKAADECRMVYRYICRALDQSRSRGGRKHGQRKPARSNG